MSARLDACFAALKASGKKAFVPFIMAGDPDMPKAQALLNMLPDAGADIIELGVPFSDPMADGPVIEAAGRRALAQGVSLEDVCDMAASFRTQNDSTPIVLMGYYNPVYHMGVEAFAKRAQQSGVDGIILVDVPPEEAKEIEPVLKQHGIAMVRLIAPTSLGDRLPVLLEHASGYVYYVSIAGITGAQAADKTVLAEQLQQLKESTDLPVTVGFGIKTAEQVRDFAPLADGVVVGSAIVKLIGEHGGDPDLVDKVKAFVSELSQAC